MLAHSMFCEQEEKTKVVTSSTETTSWSVLHCAISCEDLDVLRLLFSLGARANVTTGSKWSLLHEGWFLHADAQFQLST